MVSASDAPAIDLRDVRKIYRRKVHALRGVCLQVLPGEIFGLLGPNGAGKTTLVKILMTVVRPTSAVGTVLGRPLGHRPTLGRIGYLPENHRFPGYLTGRQVLDYYAALAKVDRQARRRRSEELLELVGMSAWGTTRVGTYSKGMQQRIGLAQALMNDPELVVLDEPTDGLDPVGRREVREILLRLRGEGRTVFLNSHLLSEVERLCDRVAILAGGRVVRQGTLDELTSSGSYYEIGLAGTPGEPLRSAIREALPCRLAPRPQPPRATAGVGVVADVVPIETGSLAGGETIELDGSLIRIRTDRAEVVQPLIDALRGRNLVIQSLRPVRKSLEDSFVETVSAAAGPGSAIRTGEGSR